MGLLDSHITSNRARAERAYQNTSAATNVNPEYVTNQVNQKPKDYESGTGVALGAYPVGDGLVQRVSWNDNTDTWEDLGNPILTQPYSPRSVENITDLRDISTNKVRAVYVQKPDGQSGIFLPKQTDPFGNGDDGATALQATDGTWWVRKAALNTDVVRPEWFGLIRGTTDEQTARVQRAIEWLHDQERGGTVKIPEGTFWVRNILLRSGVNLIGEGPGSTVLKMYDVEGTRLESTNDTVLSGTIQDTNGEYAANLLSTHLNWNGEVETQKPDRSRARDPNNTNWDVEDITVAGMTLDHRFAVVNGTYPTDKNGNPIGSELGQNNSDSGCCLRIANSGKVRIENLVLKNARHDGLELGFDEVGGWDLSTARDIRIENCLRTGVAHICGRESTAESIQILDGANVGGYDLEPNLDDVIAKENVVSNVKSNREIKCVGRALSVLEGNIFENCMASGYVIEDTFSSRGSVLKDCTAVYNGDTDSALRFRTRGGMPNLAQSNVEPVKIVRFSAVGEYPKAWTQGPGTLQSVDIINSYFEAEDADPILFPYRIRLIRNLFDFSNSSSAIEFTFGSSSVVEVQGQVEIRENSFDGNISDYFVNIKQGSDPPSLSKKNIIVSDNMGFESTFGDFRSGMPNRVHEANSWQVDRSALTSQDEATVDAAYGSEEQGVIQNNRTRIAELESRLQARGLIE